MLVDDIQVFFLITNITNKLTDNIRPYVSEWSNGSLGLVLDRSQHILCGDSLGFCLLNVGDRGVHIRECRILWNL